MAHLVTPVALNNSASQIANAQATTLAHYGDTCLFSSSHLGSMHPQSLGNTHVEHTHEALTAIWYNSVQYKDHSLTDARVGQRLLHGISKFNE